MSRKRRSFVRFLEFFVIGVLFGLGEDLLAIHFATDVTIDAKMIGIVFLVALPFAVFTELVVDHPDFWRKLIPFKNNDNKKEA